MYGKEFRDRRLHFLVNSIIPFSRESVTSAVGEVWRAKLPFGPEEEIYGLSFLSMVNAVTDMFSGLDRYFARGPSRMDIKLVADLLETLLLQLSDKAKLSGAGLTSSLDVDSADEVMQAELALLHENLLSPDEYDRLQAVQDVLTLNLIHLPHYVQSDFMGLEQAVDQAIRKSLGPGFTRDDLTKLAMALTECKRQGLDWVRPQKDVLTKYRHLVLTPQLLFDTTLEHLYQFPPFLIQSGHREYSLIVVEQPFVWIKRTEIEFIKSVKRHYPNVTGDSLEKLLKEYLIRRKLVLDNSPPLGMMEVESPHPNHFQNAQESLRISRNTREDIFAVLRNPQQAEIEIDLVANHSEGFSIIGETKYVTRYKNAETHYYQGSAEKEPERDRLQKLSDYLNHHPSRKTEFGIPEGNIVVPVFITNAVGPLFADRDGVVKACPMEVMKVEPFYRLVKTGAERIASGTFHSGVRANSKCSCSLEGAENKGIEQTPSVRGRCSRHDSSSWLSCWASMSGYSFPRLVPFAARESRM